MFGVRRTPNTPNTLRGALLVSRILLGFCVLAVPLLPWETPEQAGYVSWPCRRSTSRMWSHITLVVALAWAVIRSPLLVVSVGPRAALGDEEDEAQVVDRAVTRHGLRPRHFRYSGRRPGCCNPCDPSSRSSRLSPSGPSAGLLCLR